jgi:predicted protein tyrosine phosphatase
MLNEKRRVLFVCDRNQLRSPTAEKIFSRCERLEVRSRGLRASANRRLIEDDVAWAEVIFVMEPEHKKQLLRNFREAARLRQICVLDIPDEYGFMDQELVMLLTAGVRTVLGEDAIRGCAG